MNGLVALGLLYLFLRGRDNATPATKGKGGSPWTTDAAKAPPAAAAPKAPPRTSARKA